MKYFKSDYDTWYWFFSRKIDMVRCRVKRFFIPHHKKVINSIPKEWCDSDEVLRLVNFAVITEFFEDEIGGESGIKEYIETNREILTNPEYSDRPAAIDNSKSHIEFYEWLHKTYNFIVLDRPTLMEKLNNAHPYEPIDDIDEWLKKLNDPMTEEEYNEKYGDVNKLEKEIEDKDTKVLMDLVKYRGYFWT